MDGQATRVVFLWTGATAVGVAGMLLLLLVVPALGFTGLLSAVWLIFLPIGLAQWLFLRRLTGCSPLWIPTLSVGISAAAFLFSRLPESLWGVVDDESILTLTIMFALMGATVGLLQWPLLRRELSRAAWWIAASALGLGLGFGLALGTDLINRSENAAYLLVLITYCMVTGLALAWLLGQGRAPSTSGLAMTGNALPGPAGDEA